MAVEPGARSRGRGGDASFDVILTKLDAIDLRLTETRQDAREARDAATRLTERVDAQGLPAQLTELRAEMKAGFVEARSDLVNSISRLTDETRHTLDDHEGRIKALEDDRAERDGGRSVMAWLVEHAPWFVAIVMTLAAALGWKSKL